MERILEDQKAKFLVSQNGEIIWKKQHNFLRNNFFRNFKEKVSVNIYVILITHNYVAHISENDAFHTDNVFILSSFLCIQCHMKNTCLHPSILFLHIAFLLTVFKFLSKAFGNFWCFSKTCEVFSPLPHNSWAL